MGLGRTLAGTPHCYVTGLQPQGLGGLAQQAQEPPALCHAVTLRAEAESEGSGPRCLRQVTELPCLSRLPHDTCLATQPAQVQGAAWS